MLQSPVLYKTPWMILSKSVILPKKRLCFFIFLFCAQTCVIKSCRSSTQRDSFDLATKSGTLG